MVDENFLEIGKSNQKKRRNRLCKGSELKKGTSNVCWKVHSQRYVPVVSAYVLKMILKCIDLDLSVDVQDMAVALVSKCLSVYLMNIQYSYGIVSGLGIGSQGLEFFWIHSV